MLNKLPWDDYFMSLAKLVAKRSIDPDTQHGTIIVDADHRIISTGYNSPPKGISDDIVPLTRPAKYKWMNHSELNAIIYARQSLKGCTIYQTGPSCSMCWLTIANSGIVRQVYGSLSSNCVSEEDIAVQELMAKIIGIDRVQYLQF